MQDETRKWRLYGRSAGRALSPLRRERVHKWLPRLALPEGRLNRTALTWSGPVTLEIGFGGGEHLIGRALAEPGTLHLGVEPFLDGIGKVAEACEVTAPTNMKIQRGDGRIVLERCEPGLFDTIYLMFPDPWPKSRHAKRRFIQPEVVSLIHTVLKPGGRLIVGTDMRHYLDWTLWHCRRHGGFEWLASSAKDWRTPPAGHVSTRYEVKNLGDCKPAFLQFAKRQSD